jgi:hypothetical protein
MMGPTASVIGGTVIITGLSVLKDVHKGQDPVKPVVFGFMLGGALLLVSFFSGALAKALALMGVVGAFTVNGKDALSILGAISG